MKLMKLICAASGVGAVTLILAGTAAADSANLAVTGPDSTQAVSSTNTASTSTTNTNNVATTNVNGQQAGTGSVGAIDNTTVGGLGSGSAQNVAGTTTNISIANGPMASAPAQGGVGAAVVPTAATTMTPVATGGKGGLAVPQTGGQGAAILPVTGPEVPVDVSALLNAWHPSITQNDAGALDASDRITTSMWATASLLSLLGGAVSVVRERRKQRGFA